MNIKHMMWECGIRQKDLAREMGIANSELCHRLYDEIDGKLPREKELEILDNLMDMLKNRQRRIDIALTAIEMEIKYE